METQNVKLQDQIKRLMGMDKVYFLNSIDMTSKAHEAQAIQKCAPEAEFVDLVKNGTLRVQERLQQENYMLKDCLILL